MSRPMTLRVDPSRRTAIASIIVVLHVALAGLLTRSPPLPPVPHVVEMTVAAVPAAPPAIAEREPVPEASLLFDARMAAPRFDIAAPASTASCDLLTALDVALANDPAVAAALAPLAVTAAPAIMAWNGSWSEQPTATPIRHAVATVLSASRAECLDEPLTGPRLVFVPVDGTTVSVALGSGSWRWRDLSLGT